MSSMAISSESVTSPVGDAEQLRKALAGLRTFDKLVVSILADKNAEERKCLRQRYAETYGEDLLEAFDSEANANGGFERFVVFWTLDSAERDAYLASRAIRSGSYAVLVEITCARSSEHLISAKQAYHAQYKKSLEEDVTGRITGIFPELLLPLISSYRYTGPEVDITLAQAEAVVLRQKISEKAYSDRSLIWILANRSKAQVNAMLDHYKNAFGNDVNKDLKADPNDEFLALLRATIKCLIRPEKYFEKVLRMALGAERRDEEALVRVLSTRAEVEMKLVAEEYRRKNGAFLNPGYEMLQSLVARSEA